MVRPLRLPLIALAAAALIAGLHAGLQRIGWIEMPPAGELAVWHGPLMVAGFFATLIGLERAVAFGASWLYAAPALSGASAAALILDANASLAALIAVAGSAILSIGGLMAWRRHPALFMAALAAGAVALLVANLLWLLHGLSPAVALWWAGFLTLVIAAERLELSRVLQHGRVAHVFFMASAAIFVTGLATLLFDEPAGYKVTGIGVLALTTWLLAYDVVRRTIRANGLTRYMAVALLAGYAWLGLSGLLLIRPDAMSGFFQDAILHALFVGFAFSMVFAHAAVIFPAVIGVEMPYRRLFYLPLALLHISLALRVAADALEMSAGRSLAGALNGAAILLFFMLLVASAATAAHERRNRHRRTMLRGNLS